MNKSAIACQFSIDRLFRGRKLAYLWTFTTPEVVPVDVTALMWSDLSRDLRRRLGFVGVRCFELHPGGHGLHVHFVTYQRHDVNAVRHLSTLHGFGRINVKKMPASAAPYIAKYLRKASRAPELKGKRLWSCVGYKDGSKVKDISIDSPVSREIKKISDDDLFRIVGGECYWANSDKMPLLKKLMRPDSLRLRNHLKFLFAFHRVNSSAFYLSASVDQDTGCTKVSLRKRELEGFAGQYFVIPDRENSFLVSEARSCFGRTLVDWERLAIQHENSMSGCGRFDVGEFERRAAVA